MPALLNFPAELPAPAVIDWREPEESGRRKLTYAQLLSETNHLKARFKSRLKAGDHCILFMDQCVELAPAFLALSGLGVCVSAVSPQAGTLRLKKIRDLLGNAQIVSTLPHSADFAFVPEREWLCVSLPGTRQEASGDGFPEMDPGMDSFVLYTSGTTGTPKGIVYTNADLLFAADNLATSCKLPERNQELLFVTPTHSDGWQRVLATLRRGGTLHLAGGLQSMQKVPRLIDLLRSAGVTSLFLPSPLIPLMVRLPSEITLKLSRELRSIELGSTMIPRAMIEELSGRFPDAGLYYHYGLTEASRATTLDCRRFPEKLGTVGTPNPGYEVRTQDGMIQIRCERRPRKRITETGESSDREEWLTTRDVGELDADGFLLFRGRKDDLISVGGFHCYPNEITQAVLADPGVADTELVIDRDSQSIFGDRIRLLVVPVAGSQGSELLRSLKSALPTFLHSSISLCDRIPRNQSGKFIPGEELK